ncbi:hypothetical protein BKA66DRAFT_438583 [Pyrenochaeta sp. MPI-SDFR-AT-0127]|nr:hypothetical protein BKA66DRAFT_438583 [Pyrenochaeta sp. MPI-SDFR-AT-0127]
MPIRRTIEDSQSKIRTAHDKLGNERDMSSLTRHIQAMVSPRIPSYTLGRLLVSFSQQNRRRTSTSSACLPTEFEDRVREAASIAATRHARRLSLAQTTRSRAGLWSGWRWSCVGRGRCRPAGKRSRANAIRIAYTCSCRGVRRRDIIGNTVPENMVAAERRLEELIEATIREAEAEARGWSLQTSSFKQLN